MSSYVPWVWNCWTAYVPRSWISSDDLSPAPLKCTCCVCESGPVRTSHSEPPPCSGRDSQVRCARSMERRSPARTVPVKERTQTVTYKDLNALCTNVHKQIKFKMMNGVLSYLIHIWDALRNVVLCAKGTNDAVGVLGQGQKRVQWRDIVRSRGRHCKVWYAGNLTVSWNS